MLVVGAVIVRDGLVLSTRRGPYSSLPGLWEFPGGKVEPGESLHAALVREIREELGAQILVGELLETTTHHYPSGAVTLTTFRCVLLSEEVVLAEHDAAVWLPPKALSTLRWAHLPTVQRLNP